jgi:hypothetical protein
VFVLARGRSSASTSGFRRGIRGGERGTVSVDVRPRSVHAPRTHKSSGSSPGSSTNFGGGICVQIFLRMRTPAVTSGSFKNSHPIAGSHQGGSDQVRDSLTGSSIFTAFSHIFYPPIPERLCLFSVFCLL